MVQLSCAADTPDAAVMWAESGGSKLEGLAVRGRDLGPEEA